MRRTTTYLVILLALALAVPAGAQSLTGSITGTILDEQGGALPGVNVTLTGKTGSRTDVTDGKGAYRFLALNPGIYSVLAELPGFTSKRQDNLTIQIGTQLAVDLDLSIGGIEETIEVVGEAPVVDVASTKTDNVLSQDMLFNLPIRVGLAIDMMDYAPGVNDNTAFGAENSSNGLLLDGVDTRDPSGGSAWTFYSYNLIDEVQVSGLGAPAEYGAFMGAVINTVTKSGGNNYQGLFEAYYSKDSLAGDNITDEIAAANATLALPSVVERSIDLTGQLSGPIIPDKLFFFISATRRNEKQDPTGPRTNYEVFTPRLAVKINYQPSTNDHFAANVQMDNYFVRGRAGWSSLTDTDELTNIEDAPGWNWAGSWRHIFGSRTFSEVRYSGWTGFFDLNPTPGPPEEVPGHYDWSTGLYSDSQGWIYYADRGRHQVNASISHFAEAFGKHDLKFGVEVERSRMRDRTSYGDLFYYDYTAYYPVGQYSAMSWGYDFEGRNHRESVYLQDAWQPTDRLTINAGVRFDNLRGVSPALDATVYENKNWAPRLGFALDVLGDYTTVLKGTFSQYYEGGFVNAFEEALPGFDDQVFYFYDPSGTDVVGPQGNAFTEYDRDSAATPYVVDPDMKHPRVDEITLGIERALTNDVRLSVTGVYREDSNLQGSVIPDARWSAVQTTNDLTGQPLTVYWWENRSESEDYKLFTNPDGFQYLDLNGNVLGTAAATRSYRALMFVLDKRFSNRWQGRISYVLSKAEGTQDNTGGSYGASTLYESPSRALVNQNGRLTNDRTHELKIMGSFEVPVVDVSINAYWRTLSGRNYEPYIRFGRSTINFPSSSGRNVLLEPQGSRRRDMAHLLDLRFEKIFRVGDTGDRIAVFADVGNVFNSSLITGVQTRYPDRTIGDDPVVFGGPTGITAARQITLGARWSF